MSIFILVTSNYAHGNHIDVYSNNVNKVGLLSLDDNSEKNITNVKVNYNPVAEQIFVSFKLSKAGHVSIKLMDALGNEVLNLSNSSFEGGMHNLSFETEGKVSAGFYFIRVTSGIETIVKRVSIR